MRVREYCALVGVLGSLNQDLQSPNTQSTKSSTTSGARGEEAQFHRGRTLEDGNVQTKKSSEKGKTQFIGPPGKPLNKENAQVKPLTPSLVNSSLYSL